MSLIYSQFKTCSSVVTLQQIQDAISQALAFAKVNHVGVDLDINGVVLYIAPYDSLSKIFNEYRDNRMELDLRRSV